MSHQLATSKAHQSPNCPLKIHTPGTWYKNLPFLFGWACSCCMFTEWQIGHKGGSDTSGRLRWTQRPCWVVYGWNDKSWTFHHLITLNHFKWTLKWIRREWAMQRTTHLRRSLYSLLCYGHGVMAYCYNFLCVSVILFLCLWYILQRFSSSLSFVFDFHLKEKTKKLWSHFLMQIIYLFLLFFFLFCFSQIYSFLSLHLHCDV